MDTGPSSGIPPTVNRRHETRLPEEALILAEVTVDIEREVRGSPKTLRLAVRGGHLGCSWFSGSDTPFTDTAPRHLFFGSGPYADLSGMPGHFTITDAWAVSNDDIVKTPADGDLPLTEVLLEIADHPAPPASSGPFEREPGVTLESPIPSP